MRTPKGEGNPKMHTLKNKTLGLLVAALLSFGAMPALASAQDPTADQYDPSTITFENSTGDGGGGGLNESVGSLPFTGFDVIAMLAGALAVTGLGLALQRAVSREPRDLR
jgi:hypothetical protein